MAAEPSHLHIVLFPFMAQSHMIPVLDIARMFAARNVKATIITTPINAPTFTKAIETGHKPRNLFINVEIFKFPAQEVGLPEGCENVELIMRQQGLVPRFFQATQMLQQQLEMYLDRVRPDCLVVDTFFPWATDSATKFNIPRLVFHGMGYFALCAQEIIRLYKPFENVSSDDATIVLPLIPDEVKMLCSQIPPELLEDRDNDNNSFRKRLNNQIRKSEIERYGVIINSFYELEPKYAGFFKKELGRKAWHIGPVSLCNRPIKEKSQRGKQTSIDEHECLTWLNSKKSASVVYICFGSIAHSMTPQLHEIAVALEISRKNFIWVVRNGDRYSGKNVAEWLPQGFEERTKGKGLIIRGWAPQILILEHEAVGAFVTHCGWNSTLEAIAAGVPMVTWPMFAEQFYNEKLVTEILGIGVSVGVKKWNETPSVEDLISREVIENAVREAMEGEKTEERRQRAKQLRGMAWKAVAEGGSSYCDLGALIDELMSYHAQKHL